MHCTRVSILEQLRTKHGEAGSGIIKDRSELDYLRVFASKPSVVGRALGDIDLPGEFGSSIIHVRRGDSDVLARPDLVLEFGDRVGLLANRKDFGAMRKLFGDSIQGTAEFSYISIGLGMALGFLIGAIQLPLPGIGKLSIGLAGVLIIALILGNQRRTGGMNWTKGKGWQGVIQSFGVKKKQHKSRKTVREVASLGPISPSNVMYSVPRAGQMGFHQRTEYDKRIMVMGNTENNQIRINPDGGYTHFGLVKGDFIILKGSVPGTYRRLIKLRSQIRNAPAKITKPNILEVVI